MGRVYEVVLDPKAKILDSTEPLPDERVREILKGTSVREDTLRSLSQHDLSDMKCMKSLVERYTNENGYEYLTRKMGCDALKITEDRWHTWDYYPGRLELHAEKFAETPVTYVIYNAESISRFFRFDVENHLRLRAAERVRQRGPHKG